MIKYYLNLITINSNMQKIFKDSKNIIKLIVSKKNIFLLKDELRNQIEFYIDIL